MEIEILESIVTAIEAVGDLAVANTDLLLYHDTLINYAFIGIGLLFAWNCYLTYKLHK